MEQSRKNKGFISIKYIILLLICIATMNVINRYYVFMFIALGLFFVLKPKRKIYFDIFPISLLVILGLSWVLLSPESTASIFGVIKPFTYVLCYVAGMALIKDDDDYSFEATPYKLFYKVVVAVALGPFVHYLLNWITNLGATERNTADIWTGETMAATGQAALACIPLALAIACLFSKNKVWIKITSVLTVALVLVYNLVLAGRTLILLFLVIVGVALLHRLIMQKKGRIKVVLIVLAIVILLLAIYQFDTFGVKSYIEDSPLYNRFFGVNSNIDLDEDSRLDRKLYYWQNFDQHLFGGAHFRQDVGYAHDIFLDTYDEAGVFAFIAIVAYILLTIWRLFKCVSDKTLPFAFRQIVLCIYVIIYIEFMIEPILQGMPWMFASFCLIDGYVAGILRHKRKVECNRLKVDSI